MLVDPLPVVRAGLVLLLDGCAEVEVLAEAGSADEAIDAIARVRRTRVVVLIGLGVQGDHDAPWLIRSIRERYPAHAVLAMGANADPTSISRALFVGADGYVDKCIPPDTFLEAIRRAGDREMVLEGPRRRRRRPDRRRDRAAARAGCPADRARA